MSEHTSKVRWPWLLLAVLGLGGALILPLRARSADDAAPASTKPMGGIMAPELLLRPAQSSATLESERAGQRKPASVPESSPKQKEGLSDSPYGRMGHGGGDRDDDTPTEVTGPVAAGPIGPPVAQPAPATTPATTPDQLRKQLPGRFALSAPTAMEVGRSEHVTVVAAIEQLRALVTSDLQAVTSGPSAQTVSTKDLPLSRLLRIELRSDTDADFEIRSFTPAEQRLSGEQTTTWEWSVTPKSPGEKHLTVVISNLVDGQGAPIAVTIAHRQLQVSLSTVQRIRELAGTASSAGSALAGLFGTWMGLLKPLLQRRREEEGKVTAKTDSAAKSSDPPKPPSDKPAPGPDAAAASSKSDTEKT